MGIREFSWPPTSRRPLTRQCRLLATTPSAWGTAARDPCAVVEAGAPSAASLNASLGAAVPWSWQRRLAMRRARSRYAREHGIDLIVVGTHGRTGMSRALWAVAERVIRTAPCPVLAVPFPAGRPAESEAGTAAPVTISRCVVCAATSPDLICEPCRARIRGEALRHKQADERTGRTSG
jgi:hypothetical protein